MLATQSKTTINELVPLLIVNNIARSAAFYQQQLGFEITSKWEPASMLAWCRLERDGSAVMLQQACEEDGPTTGRGHGVGFFFHCDNAAVMHAELIARGLAVAPPQTAFYGMNQIFLKDPDGYELCFQSAVTDLAESQSPRPDCRGD